MADLLKNLMLERDQLRGKLGQLNQFLEQAPDGRLEWNQRGDQQRYYYVKEAADGSPSQRTYLKKKDLRLATALASKSYYRKLIPFLIEELEKVESLIDFLSRQNKERTFDNLSPGYRKLVKPLYYSDQTVLKKWNELPYIKTKEDAEHIHKTENGEYTRSKSEQIIANKLFYMGIPYRYEQDLLLKGYDKPIRPDFTVLNVRERKVIYMEHAGMLSDSNYVGSLPWKLNLYGKNDILLGDKLVLTWENDRIPLNQDVLDKLIREFFL